MILKKDVILTAKTHRYDIVLWTGLKKKMKTIVQKTKYINVILFGGQVSVWEKEWSWRKEGGGVPRKTSMQA